MAGFSRDARCRAFSKLTALPLFLALLNVAPIGDSASAEEARMKVQRSAPKALPSDQGSKQTGARKRKLPKAQPLCAPVGGTRPQRC
jgi:hypothetical protein